MKTFRMPIAAVFAVLAAFAMGCQLDFGARLNVFYDPNGATFGAAPTDRSTYSEGATVTVLGNTGNLAKAEYAFIGWNTSTDGTGTRYLPGASFQMPSESVELYAQWEATYAISYDANGSTDGAVPSDPNRYRAGETVTVLGNTGGLARAGCTYVGWNTAQGGAGTRYTEGQAFAMGAADAVLFAEWSANGYQVVFDANGGTGSMDPLPIAYGATAGLTLNAFSREHYSFSGWSDYPNGPIVCGDGEGYTMAGEGVILYALWTLISYDLAFDSNGGTGTMAPLAITYGMAANLTPNAFSRDGYTFQGWSSSAGGSVEYADGASYTMVTEGATLYSVWRVDPARLSSGSPAANGNFGFAVAISGDYAIVSDLNATVDGYSLAGTARIFHRTADNLWDSGFEIVPTNPNDESHFGYAVAISGDYAIVGAFHNNVGGATWAGAAYVFHRDGPGNIWSGGRELVATDPEQYDSFGCSVGISGDYAVVGACLEGAGATNQAGAAYVFRRTGPGPDDNVWDTGVKMVSPDQHASDNFGSSVAISGDRIIIGAPNGMNDDTSTRTGTAFAFRRTGPDNAWDTGTLLVASNAADGDNFGCSVSIDGDCALVGAMHADPAGYYDTGVVYAFRQTGGAGGNAWDAGTEIPAPAPANSLNFGFSVALSGEYAVVGCIGESSAAGAAYLIHRTGANTWDAGTRISGLNQQPGDQLGYSVSLNGAYAIIGAPNDDQAADNAGAAHVWCRP